MAPNRLYLQCKQPSRHNLFCSHWKLSSNHHRLETAFKTVLQKVNRAAGQLISTWRKVKLNSILTTCFWSRSTANHDVVASWWRIACKRCYQLPTIKPAPAKALYPHMRLDQFIRPERMKGLVNLAYNEHQRVLTQYLWFMTSTTAITCRLSPRIQDRQIFPPGILKTRQFLQSQKSWRRNPENLGFYEWR